MTVARVRQARRCSARRTNGEPCRAYAIVGGTVCRTHGGSAPQVRRAATLAEYERRLRIHFDRSYSRWLAEWKSWQLDRMIVTSQLLDIPLKDVTPFDIGWCHAWYGQPASEDAAPQMRMDRRFYTVRPHQPEPG